MEEIDELKRDLRKKDEILHIYQRKLTEVE
jgi:hypothetical protein